MGNKTGRPRRNGKAPEGTPTPKQVAFAPQPTPTLDDVQAMINNNPQALAQAENFALRRTLAERDAEILKLTIQLGEKAEAKT